MPHPVENDLALLAGGDTSRTRRFLLGRHVRSCGECQDKVAEYRALRAELSHSELPFLNWSVLAADMRANIHLGLEAGACVREAPVAPGRWTPRWNAGLTVGFASLILLAGSSLLVRNMRPPESLTAGAAVLEATRSGVEVRTGANSLKLLNRQGEASNQTVSARGDIGTRSIDSETGAVTINVVYLQ